MIIPIRCIGCGKPIAHLWEEYAKRVKKGEEPNKVLDDLGLDRYCCRSLFLSHVHLIDKVAKYQRA